MKTNADFFLHLDFRLLRSRRFRVSMGLCSSYQCGRNGLIYENVTWFFFFYCKIHFTISNMLKNEWILYLKTDDISYFCILQRVNQCNLLILGSRLIFCPPEVAASAQTRSSAKFPNISDREDSAPDSLKFFRGDSLHFYIFCFGSVHQERSSFWTVAEAERPLPCLVSSDRWQK